MDRLVLIIRQAAALALLLALVLAPVTDATTHGPALLMAKADHAAHQAEHHAERGGHDHAHHDATDHDHTSGVILPANTAFTVPEGRDIWAGHARQSVGIATPGPRRPPRSLT